LQAYIFPVARTWHAHTSPNPPLPRTRYIRKVLYVTGWLEIKWNVNKIQKIIHLDAQHNERLAQIWSKNVQWRTGELA
jgi:hypothetical protein